jgi:GntR family transcriptional regulator, transcriptional repressor for pyruvate dehydrogenase complex
LSEAEHPDWTPVKRATLSEEIADQLITSILSGRYRFGEKLPPERDLARYLAVGRPTVREAIRRLAVIGLVDVRQGEGTFVVNNHLDFVSRAFGWAVLLDPQVASEVVETRIAIETEIAGLAAMRVTADDVAELRGLLETMKRSQGETQRFSDADLEFHLVLARVARNTTLLRLLEATRSLLKQWITRALTERSVYEAALRQHAEVLSAIEERDEVAARRAMRQHLEEMGRQLLATNTGDLAEVGDDRRVRPDERIVDEPKVV